MSQNTTLNNALMSNATYVENITKEKLFERKFSERLAGDFLKAFTVINQETDNDSGFHVTVFQNTTTGVYTVAFAGTNPKSQADLANDYDINMSGMATEQFIHAYNYYQEITHLNNELINKISISMVKPSSGQYVEQIKTYSQVQPPYTVTRYFILDRVENPNTSAKIPEGATIEFTGHSLGGHLAGLMSMITGKQATVFNAPGYKTGFLDNPNVSNVSSVDCLIVNLLGGQVNQSGVTHFMNDDFVSLADLAA